jgi:hypothetical protein
MPLSSYSLVTLPDLLPSLLQLCLVSAYLLFQLPQLTSDEITFRLAEVFCSLSQFNR